MRRISQLCIVTSPQKLRGSNARKTCSRRAAAVAIRAQSDERCSAHRTAYLYHRQRTYERMPADHLPDCSTRVSKVRLTLCLHFFSGTTREFIPLSKPPLPCKSTASGSEVIASSSLCFEYERRRTRPMGSPTHRSPGDRSRCTYGPDEMENGVAHEMRDTDMGCWDS